MDANLALMDIEMVEISFQNLISANYINCDDQMILRRGHEYIKMRLEEKNIYNI